MTLNVKPIPASATFPAPLGDLTLDLVDESGCKINVVLAVQGHAPSMHEFPIGKSGSVKVKLHFDKAGSYNGSFTVYAFTEGAFSRHVDFTLKVNGKKSVTVTGDVAKNPGFENASGSFALDIA